MLHVTQNQLYRAAITKMIIPERHQGRGIGSALMNAGELAAIRAQRTSLVLDTDAENGASALYERLGFIMAGVIPGYALRPHGEVTATIIYWKSIGALALMDAR